MLSNYNKVLNVFFDDPLPEGGHQLRQIARKINLAPKSTKQYLNILEKEKLIISKPHRVYGFPTYKVNWDNEEYKLKKRLYNIKSLYDSGLINYIDDKLMPHVIVFYGSAAKGEDTTESDIDLFIQSSEKEPDLTKFEKLLNRKIHIFLENNFKNRGIEYKNNLINGIVMKGYLRWDY